MPTPTVNPELQKDFAIQAVELLRAAGFEAYWAGGCVRDLLLGGLPKDYDVATAATPKQVRKVFRDFHTLGVGAAFGVIIVVGPQGAGQLDVATFRADDTYSDGRRPDSVTFSTAQEDVQRRDFTINGLLFDPIEQRVIDYVGGQLDLESQIIRAIGEPVVRLAEDKLRMLRAVRFAARLGFLIDRQTRSAIEEMVAEISVVSAERITEELRSMLAHPTRATAISLCREIGLSLHILPEAEDAHRRSDGSASDAAWDYTLRQMDALEAPSLPLTLAVLLRNYAAGVKQRERSNRLMEFGRRMRISTDDAQRLDWLVRHGRGLWGARKRPWSQVQRMLIGNGIRELIAMHQAELAVIAEDHPTDEDRLANWRADLDFCSQRLDGPKEQLDPAPLITGDDLIAAGVPRGKHYQRILTVVRDAQLDGKIDTPEEGLQHALVSWRSLKG
ncbi:MAG: CCA tRNA nucleotidyltransferase [Pirellulales bacterium]|nr:CCA tRNA nucleotidyltransferase [Pirellulales bacterium]